MPKPALRDLMQSRLTLLTEALDGKTLTREALKVWIAGTVAVLESSQKAPGVTPDPAGATNGGNGNGHRPKLDDAAFLGELRKNTAYSHLDFDRELGKADAWLLAHPGRQRTRSYLVNWLNKAAETQRGVNVRPQPKPFVRTVRKVEPPISAAERSAAVAQAEQAIAGASGPLKPILERTLARLKAGA